MTLLQEFKQSLDDQFPRKEWPLTLKVLWHDGKGDWQKAHTIAEGGTNQEMAWVHAYLHRKEGDRWNAEYWYRKANKSLPNITLDEEWDALVDYFLSNGKS